MRVLVLLSAAMLLTTCASRDDRNIFTGPCASGVGDTNRQAPIVCVNQSGRTLSVSPDPITAHDQMRGGGPVMLHWYTRTGTGDLQVSIENGCVADLTCDGNGHCSARSIPGANKSCKYTVQIKGSSDPLDPTVVIQPCCS